MIMSMEMWLLAIRPKLYFITKVLFQKTNLYIECLSEVDYQIISSNFAALIFSLITLGHVEVLRIPLLIVALEVGPCPLR